MSTEDEELAQVKTDVDKLVSEYLSSRDLTEATAVMTELFSLSDLDNEVRQITHPKLGLLALSPPVSERE
jgi:hypothetical protein